MQRGHLARWVAIGLLAAAWTLAPPGSTGGWLGAGPPTDHHPVARTVHLGLPTLTAAPLSGTVGRGVQTARRLRSFLWIAALLTAVTGVVAGGLPADRRRRSPSVPFTAWRAAACGRRGPPLAFA